MLAALDREFAALYATDGRPSIAPERPLRALLLQAAGRKNVTWGVTYCSMAKAKPLFYLTYYWLISLVSIA